MEQRANIKVCYKFWKTATETRKILVQVYGREAVSIKCVYEWFKRFREGKEMTEEEPCSGRLTTSRTPEMIEKGRQSSFSNFPLLHLRHSSFSNPSFASPSSQALHLTSPGEPPMLYGHQRCTFCGRECHRRSFDSRSA